jgi:hypothetical protein
VEKNFEDSTRHTFDLAHVEDAFNGSIEPLIGDEDYRIISITASVKLFSGRGRARVQDIADFSAIETERILKIIDATRGEHPRSALYVLFEVKIDCNALGKTLSQQAQTANTTLSFLNSLNGFSTNTCFGCQTRSLTQKISKADVE